MGAGNTVPADTLFVHIRPYRFCMTTANSNCYQEGRARCSAFMEDWKEWSKYNGDFHNHLAVHRT